MKFLKYDFLEVDDGLFNGRNSRRNNSQKNIKLDKKAFNLKKKTVGYLGILSTIIIMEDFGVSKEKTKEVVKSIFIQNYVSDQKKELIYQQLEEQYKKKIENNNN